MKNILLTSIFTFFSLTLCSQDWKITHPFPNYFNLLDGYFEEENNMIIIGYHGVILQSNNGGQDWNELPAFTDKNLKFIEPIPNTNGQQLLLASEDAIYKSEDAGSTWNLKTSGIVIDDVIELLVVNPNVIYATAREDQFLKSIDGGDTWVSTNSGTNAFFWELSFITEDEGFGLTYNGKIYHTTNGGIVWDSLNTIPAVSGRTIHFVDANVGYASGFWTTLFKTTDGGLTWTEYSSTGYPAQAYELTIASNGNWYCRSQNGSQLYQSSDEGINWTNSTPTGENGGRFRSMNILDDGKIFLVGEYQTVLKSPDWGSTWVDYFDAPKMSLRFVKFKNENIGLAGGNDTRVLKTTDGGTTWQLSNETISNIFDIEVDSNGDWYVALGYNGIWKSTDDGTTWEQKFDSDPAVLGLERAPNGDMYGVSNIAGKSVFRSTDDGETWSVIPLTTTWTILQIEFVSDTKGYVVAKEGLLVTNDGGDTWAEDSFTSANNFSHVFFLDENTGWICTSNFMHKTTDGGATWSQQTSGGKNSTFFLDENIGYSIDGSFDNGEIYKSEDGGTSWQLVYNAPYFMRAITGVGNTDDIVVVGNGGQIILGEDETISIFKINSTNDLRIFPNPGNEFVILDHQFINSELVIYNLQGQVVSRKNLDQQSQPKISTSFLKTGTYFFRVVGNEEQWIGKWVKE